MSDVTDNSYLDQPLGEFLGAVASSEPAPGGGAVAATAASMAAGLAGMAARFATGKVADAPDLAARADRVRDRLVGLAQADAEAYTKVASAYRLPREPDPEPRRQRLREALQGAAEVPADIASGSADVAELAARLVREGNPNLVGDAVTAAFLADASARSAANLVRINVKSGNLEAQLATHADRCAARAAESAAQARAGGSTEARGDARAG